MAKETVRINNRIQAPELRIITEEGNLGVMSTTAAMEKAKSLGLDLIEISPDARPPVAKIMDYGKFLYESKKKQKGVKGTISELKTLQVKIATGEHDLELKAKKASEFLKEGHRVKIDLFLAGRAKYLEKNFLESRLERILRFISENFRIADGPKRGPKGLTVILEREKSNKEKPPVANAPQSSQPPIINNNENK